MTRGKNKAIMTGVCIKTNWVYWAAMGITHSPVSQISLIGSNSYC